MKKLILIAFALLPFAGIGQHINPNLEDSVSKSDSVWETVFNIWADDMTKGQARIFNDFRLDSTWSEVIDGWSFIYVTNESFDTVAVHEISPEGRVGYQFLIWTEE